MTTYDVGSGHTYANVAAVTAVINGTTLTSDARIQLYGTVTETTDPAFTGITVGSFGVYVESGPGEKFASSPLRYGVSGARWVLGYTGGGGLTVANSIGKFEILDLQILKPSTANNGYAISVSSGGSNANAGMRRCIVQIDGQSNGAVSIWDGFIEDTLIVNTSTFLTEFVRDDGNGTATNVACIDLNAAGNAASSVGFNGVGGSGFPLTCINCASANMDTDCSGSSSIVGNNNATDKSSGTTNFPATARQVDLIAATEWVAPTGASYDFNLASGSVKLKANGTATGAPATDINDAAWNASVDIGPVKAAAAATTASAFFAYTRNHLTAGAVS